MFYCKTQPGNVIPENEIMAGETRKTGSSGASAGQGQGLTMFSSKQ